MQLVGHDGFALVRPKPVPISLLDPNQPQYAALEASLPRYAYDPQRAVQMLTEMGLVRGADGAFRDKNGDAIDLEVRTSPQSQYTKASTAIAADWSRVG